MKKTDLVYDAVIVGSGIHSKVAGALRAQGGWHILFYNSPIHRALAEELSNSDSMYVESSITTASINPSLKAACITRSGAQAHETPFKSLFQIGAGAWPGPGLSGSSGFLVANRLIKQHRHTIRIEQLIA